MIVSHRHRFIFLKTNKTAGTSVEIALSRDCGQDDIITPISPVDETMRRELGHRGAQNFRPPPARWRWGDFQRWISSGFKHYRYYNHMPAREVRPLLGEDVWRDYSKLCITRNPWDRVLSMYHWRRRKAPELTLDEFMHSHYIDSLRRKGIGVYTMDGEVVVDRVLRYECLAEDLESVRRAIGLPQALQLPHAKGHWRQDRRPYQEVMSSGVAAKVAEIFAEEIRLFGYTFD